MASYGDIREAEGFVYSVELEPSVIFKPRHDKRGLATRRVEIVPRCHPDL